MRQAPSQPPNKENRMNATLAPNATAIELLGNPSTLVIIITDELGQELLRPVFECHSWNKVTEFVKFYQENSAVKNAEIQVWHYSTHLASLFVKN